MRGRTFWGLWAVCLALCLLAGCAPAGTEEREETLVYFVDTSQEVGSAIRGEPFRGQGEADVNSLVRALLAGPAGDELRSPIPSRVMVRSWRVEDGVLTLDLSENYGDLSGIELTLADYCITMTLCQLEGVEAVQITAAGQALSYRSHQVLMPEEVIGNAG